MPEDQIPLTAKLLYGIGEVPIMVTMVLFGLFVLFFYSTVMGLPGTLVGIATASGLLFDAFFDPYIGHISDKTQGRFGRRHGFMLGGGIIMGLCFWLLLSPPRDLSTIGLFFWLLATSLTFRVASAVYRIPYLSYGAELETEYEARTRLVAIRSMFGLFGTLGAATLSFVLFFPNTEPGVDPKLGYDGYPALGAGAGLLMTTCALIAIAGTWRWRNVVQFYAPPQQLRFSKQFMTALGNPSFRKVWVTFTIFFLGVVLNAVVAVHYFTWYAKISDSTTLSHIQLAFYLGALVGITPWTLLSRRVDKHHLCIASVLGTALMLLLSALLIGPDSIFGTGRATPLIAGHAIAGAFASGLWVLPGAMVADVADDDCLQGGERREGLFFGLLNFGEKLAAGGALFLGGLLIDLHVGIGPAGPENAEAVLQLGVVYGAIPGFLLIAAAMALVGYRLNRQQVHKIQGLLWRGPSPESGDIGPCAPAGHRDIDF